MSLPRGPFGCIYMDPAWGFRTYSGDERVPTLGEDPYPTMTLDELKALPVAEVAAPDCLLIMWVISSHVPQAIELAGHWGFTYRSLGPVWLKDRHPGQIEMFDDAPICDIGMGYWFRQQAEIALVFGRGSPTRLNADVRQVVAASRREHSRKPDIHGRIERLVGGPYLEMFARQSRPGWSTWGNQATKFDEVAA
ncbi:MT-A70 family methyltransferase [Phenylobacterium sp. LjRoot164]|uniref:MT-A70 family methyltransferase n=1 Tax=unclassified Phenylobacterium TaxID=2640670 RepID=UPI003ECC3806